MDSITKLAKDISVRDMLLVLKIIDYDKYKEIDELEAIRIAKKEIDEDITSAADIFAIIL